MLCLQVLLPPAGVGIVPAPHFFSRNMINIELRLLSTMLYKGDFTPVMNNVLSGEDFQTDAGKTLFQFISDYKKRGGKHKYPSLSIVRSRFDESTIDLPAPDPADNVEQLTDEIKAKRKKARLAELAAELDDASRDPSESLDSLTQALAKMRRLVTADPSTKVFSFADSISKIREDYLSGNLMPAGRPTPWPSLTKATRGWHGKEFYFIAGRPKSKKTFIALKALMHDVVVSGGTGLVFSPEMRGEQMLIRAIAIAAEVVYHEFKEAVLDEAQTRRLLQLADTFARREKETNKEYRIRLRKALNLPKGSRPGLVVVESAGKNLSWMEAQIELHRPTLVLADSLYRQSPDFDKNNDAGWRSFTATMRGTKNITMSTGVPIIATHQINRAGSSEVGGLENLALGDAAGQETDLTLRAISGTIDGKSLSALIPLGGREIAMNSGLLINSELCTDFSEVGTVVNSELIKQLMRRDLDEDDEEASPRKGRKGKDDGGTTLRRKSSIKKAGDRVRAQLPAEDAEMI